MSVIFSTAIPDAYLTLAYVFVFVLGAIIGSFLNVVIYRFHTGKSLAGSSHCLSCGEPLRWFELFPVLSYIAIRGRCRHCQSVVPIRYLLVELLTAVLFALCLSITTLILDLSVLLVLMAVLVITLTYDYYHYIIPDSLSIASTVLVGLYVSLPYLFDGGDWSQFGVQVLAALAGSGFFLFLWVISRGRWLGFGDVKLAFPLGLLVGAKSVFSFIVMSFWIGAAVSLLLLAWQYLERGKSHLRLLDSTITMKSAVPFAPFLIAGALVTFFAHVNVLSFFTFTL